MSLQIALWVIIYLEKYTKNLYVQNEIKAAADTREKRLNAF